MPRGTLEVIQFWSAPKALKTPIFSATNIDPYVILTYRTQEPKSSVSHDGGSHPQWNESFLFTVADSLSELYLKIMDKDRFTRDDYLGEAKYENFTFTGITRFIVTFFTIVTTQRITLGPLFIEGSLPETAYSVVKDAKYCGEIKVVLTFTPEQTNDLAYDGKENSGGWRESEAAYEER